MAVRATFLKLHLARQGEAGEVRLPPGLMGVREWEKTPCRAIQTPSVGCVGVCRYVQVSVGIGGPPQLSVALCSPP